MSLSTPAGAEEEGDGARGGSGTRDDPHPILDLRRAYVANMPDSSVGSVRKVARLDGRTHVVAGREPGGTWWRLRRRTRFTRDHARELREAGVSEVVLRRGLSSASFPLIWLSNRQD